MTDQVQGASFNFSAATVLITGGSNGIGLGTAKAFAEAGASVHITGRRANAADYDHDLSAFTYHALDISDRAAIEALAAGFEQLDILVHCAGGSTGDEWRMEDFDQSVAVNLNSAMHMANACKPLLAASEFPGGASVISIASMTSYFGFSMTPGYGPAKAGLVQLMKTLAMSWGEEGIRANAVAAGLTRSQLTSIVIDEMPEMVEPTLLRQAIKRTGEPEDIAAAILFLASPQASWISGQTLPVDGGFTIGM